jgi:hypothetical protein
VKEKGQGSPEGAPKSQSKPNQPEQQLHGGSIKTPERQALPSVRDVMELHLRIGDTFAKDHEYGEEYHKKWGEDREFRKEIYEKGTARDYVIFGLFHYTKFSDPERTEFAPGLSREEFQQFRSELDGLSVQEIREELRHQSKEHDRRLENTMLSGSA